MASQILAASQQQQGREHSLLMTRNSNRSELEARASKSKENQGEKWQLDCRDFKVENPTEQALKLFRVDLFAANHLPHRCAEGRMGTGGFKMSQRGQKKEDRK